MSLETLDGFFTALVAGPDVVRPSAYLDAIWGGVKNAAPVFDSEEQAQYVMDLMMRRWNEIADGLMAGEPAMPIIMDHGDGLTGRDWADGFLAGVEYHDGLAATPKLRRRTGELLEPILALTGEGERIGAARRAQVLDDLPRMVCGSVAAGRRSGRRGRRAAPIGQVRAERALPLRLRQEVQEVLRCGRRVGECPLMPPGGCKLDLIRQACVEANSPPPGRYPGARRRTASPCSASRNRPGAHPGYKRDVVMAIEPCSSPARAPHGMPAAARVRTPSGRSRIRGRASAGTRSAVPPRAIARCGRCKTVFGPSRRSS